MPAVKVLPFDPSTAGGGGGYSNVPGFTPALLISMGDANNPDDFTIHVLRPLENGDPFRVLSKLTNTPAAPAEDEQPGDDQAEDEQPGDDQAEAVKPAAAEVKPQAAKPLPPKPARGNRR